jgi:hypothetical protein
MSRTPTNSNRLSCAHIELGNTVRLELMQMECNDFVAGLRAVSDGDAGMIICRHRKAPTEH